MTCVCCCDCLWFCVCCGLSVIGLCLKRLVYCVVSCVVYCVVWFVVAYRVVCVACSELCVMRWFFCMLCATMYCIVVWSCVRRRVLLRVACVFD